MDRWVLTGLGLGLACVAVMAGPARAQRDREGGLRPEMVGGSTMESFGSAEMPPGGPPPMDEFGPPPGATRCGGPMGRPGGWGAPANGPGVTRVPAPGEWEALEPSAAQRRRMDDLRDAGQRKVIRLEAELRTAELDFRRLVAGAPPDLQAIAVQVDRIADLRAGITKAWLATCLGMREVLTPDQRTRLRHPEPGPRWAGPRPGARDDGRWPAAERSRGRRFAGSRSGEEPGLLHRLRGPRPGGWPGDTRRSGPGGARDEMRWRGPQDQPGGGEDEPGPPPQDEGVSMDAEGR